MDKRHFDVELDQLRQKLVMMATKVEILINHSIDAIRTRDAGAAEAALAMDKEIDRMEIEIEEAAISLIARYQPAAGDLRFLVGAIKINNDLERIGDHGVNIAQSAARLADRPDVKVLAEIPWMAGLAVSMLKDSLDSFISGDPAKAREVCTRDDQVDDLKDQILRIVLTFMMEKPDFISSGMTLILVARNLERIGDLATDISEEAIYIHQGKVIKHGAEQGSGEGSTTP
ncbi:MAG: phosphate signaling complex protein PhoU [Ignavibacteriales bacterium]|nr:phosphate signaling complex protein PhoU [Ignavibacteriales bacterium]